MRIAETPHTYMFTPAGERAAGHLSVALNTQTQRSVAGNEHGPQNNETSTDATAISEDLCWQILL